MYRKQTAKRNLNETKEKQMTTHTKTFSTKSHMVQFWRDFKDELIGCHEVGQVGEYVLKFSIKY